MTVRIVSNSDTKVHPGCGYCGDPDKAPTVVVYGQPMPDVITVVDPAGCRCCGDCVKKAIWLAMTETDGSRSIRVVPVKALAT